MQRDKCVFISKQTEEIVIINFMTKFLTIFNIINSFNLNTFRSHIHLRGTRI